MNGDLYLGIHTLISLQYSHEFKLLHPRNDKELKLKRRHDPFLHMSYNSNTLLRLEVAKLLPRLQGGWDMTSLMPV